MRSRTRRKSLPEAMAYSDQSVVAVSSADALTPPGSSKELKVRVSGAGRGAKLFVSVESVVEALIDGVKALKSSGGSWEDTPGAAALAEWFLAKYDNIVDEQRWDSEELVDRRPPPRKKRKQPTW